MKPRDTDVLTARSIADFGEQWTHYRDNPGYYGSLALFADLVEPLLAADQFRGATVADIGSGTGRIVRMLSDAGAAHIYAVEPSAAMEVLKTNTRDLGARVSYQHVPGDQFIVEQPLDFVVSMGVLHHIPDPKPVVARMRAALRPGGQAIVWLYGREGNGVYLAVAEPLRKITTRLPHRALVLLCRLLDVPMSAYLAACRYCRLPLWRYMRNHLGRLTPEIRRLTIYDQLNPRWAKYYTREEAIALLANSGFVDVRCHHRHGYSWLVVGRVAD
jgi:SAM-dependent methyltransferase